MDFCARVEGRIEEGRFKASMNCIRENLPSKNQALWDSIQRAFATYKKAEGERLYQRNIDGIIRGLAYSGQVSIVQAQFGKLMESAFRYGKLPPASGNQLKQLARQVSTLYRQDIQDYISQESWMLPEYRKRYNETVATYKTDATASRKAWEHLFILCKGLAKSVWPNHAARGGWDVRLAAALVQSRIAALKSNPVGPSGD